MKKLSPEEHAFFSLLSETLWLNPFGSKRIDMERKLARNEKKQIFEDPRTRLEKLNQSVSEQWLELCQNKSYRLEEYDQEEKELIQKAFLFKLHLQNRDSFALFLENQVGKTEPIDCFFAKEFVESLVSLGVSEEDSYHLLAFSFQWFRAYHFIGNGLIGNCSLMTKLRMSLWQNVFCNDILIYQKCAMDRMDDFSTLLLGEIGSGKGVVAKAIGKSGFIAYDPKRDRFAQSFEQTFAEIHLSEFPEPLIESELFGYKKGAFTGAMENYDGFLSRSTPCGSVFLNEIGGISLSLQIKLLRVLQERTYRSVGSHFYRPFQGRLIAGTNQSLDKLRRKGLFRDDFYYRLGSDQIKVPSLRERIQEDPRELQALVEVLLKDIVGSHELTDLVLTQIQKSLPADYPWLGNIRELSQCIRSILLTGNYQGQSSFLHSMDFGAEKECTAKELLHLYSNQLYRKYGTYEEVARRLDVDRKTAKKYIEEGE